MKFITIGKSPGEFRVVAPEWGVWPKLLQWILINPHHWQSPHTPETLIDGLHTHLPATNQLTSKINMDLGMGGRANVKEREREVRMGEDSR